MRSDAKLNRSPGKLKVGDNVTTDFDWEHRAVVRTVLRVSKGSDYWSGLSILVDGGEPCKCCGRPIGKEIGPVDGAWFNPALDGGEA